VIVTLGQHIEGYKNLQVGILWALCIEQQD